MTYALITAGSVQAGGSDGAAALEFLTDRMVMLGMKVEIAAGLTAISIAPVRQGRTMR